MLKIRFTQAAEQQLEDIWVYTLTEWHVDQANQYVSQIEQGLLKLLEFPFLGRARPEINTDTRSLNVQKHVIYYRVGLEYMDIIGILHGNMDVSGYFKNARTPFDEFRDNG